MKNKAVRINSVCVLAAAMIVLTASLIFAYACSEVVAVAWVLVDEVRIANDWANRLIRGYTRE